MNQLKGIQLIGTNLTSTFYSNLEVYALILCTWYFSPVTLPHVPIRTLLLAWMQSGWPALCLQAEFFHTPKSQSKVFSLLLEYIKDGSKYVTKPSISVSMYPQTQIPWTPTLHIHIPSNVVRQSIHEEKLHPLMKKTKRKVIKNYMNS